MKRVMAGAAGLALAICLQAAPPATPGGQPPAQAETHQKQKTSGKHKRSHEGQTGGSHKTAKKGTETGTSKQ